MAIRLSMGQVGLAAVLACGMGFTGIAAAQTSSGSTGTTTGTEGAGDPVQMMFKRIDADGNGSISESELETWRSSAIFRLDTDGDGKVTKQEVDAYMAQQQSQGGKAEDSSAFFQAYDTNGDGAVDQNELKAVGDKRFQSADTDANGQLSMQEWQALNGS
jgi:Ca2+-binding EF-hand superfamily protein